MHAAWATESIADQEPTLFRWLCARKEAVHTNLGHALLKPGTHRQFCQNWHWNHVAWKQVDTYTIHLYSMLSVYLDLYMQRVIGCLVQHFSCKNYWNSTARFFQIVKCWFQILWFKAFLAIRERGSFTMPSCLEVWAACSCFRGATQLVRYFCGGGWRGGGLIL